MVFPSYGCLTCKRRHLKCDSTRPSCTQCLTSSRICSWESHDGIGLLFRSENAYAQGQSRRPRKHTSRKSIQGPAACSATCYSIPPYISIPIETQAFHYWRENFATWPNDVPEIGHEYLTYALDQWGRASQDSSLHMAVAAYSLASFGRARRVQKALQDAEKFYARSVVKAQQELQSLSSTKIDQLLIATMEMTHYENAVYCTAGRRQLQSRSAPDEVGSHFWGAAAHYKGTAALLKVQQKQIPLRKAPLDRAIRRVLIRSCILRGDTVQGWLRDGSMYGEESPMLELDSLMVRAASVRSTFSQLHRGMNPLLPLSRALADALREAQELDFALATWPQSLPEEWNFSVRNVLGGDGVNNINILHDGLVHRYTSQSHAAVWNRYRAVRLMVSSIRLQLLLAVGEWTLQSSLCDAQLEGCQKDIDSLATDICRSVPFFFNRRHSTQEILESGCPVIVNNITLTEHDIMPNIAIFLAWPLAVAVSTEAVPRAQKEWLKQRLKTIGIVLGDNVVQSIADTGGLNF